MSTSRFRVVAVAREYGSGGAAIATALARRLGYQLLDRTLLERIASAARIDPDLAEQFDENVDPWVRRLWRSLWYGGFEAVSVVDETQVVDGDAMARLCRRIIEEAATVGECVIVGRGGQCVLRGRSDVFQLFVHAPREERLRRLRARLGPDADVELALEETDSKRNAYIRRHFGESWLDPRLYHLMVNAEIGEDAAVATILTALETAIPRPQA
ncbi:MAG: cytidylate kinase-like family protein [Acidobacteria bacterium]|jgi:cytidylate kinase|nr:cytidylate kinase-like family protein [Acidobacteriota bacterium]